MMPSRLTVLPPLGRNVGSGKFGTPWERMQFAFVIASMRSLAEAGDACDVLAGSSGAHAWWADWNAGDCISTPEKSKPSGVGSGNFGTPCERMQSANRTAALETLPATVRGLLAELQAPIASALAPTATAIASSRRCLPGVFRDGALCIVEGLAGRAAGSFIQADR